MARERRSFGDGASRLTFANRTTIESALGNADVIQWISGGRARGARGTDRLPAELDEVPAFEEALREVGIREQETIEVDLTLDTRIRRRPAATDNVVIRPAPASDGPQVVLYVDESGGMSWHFPDGFDARQSNRAAADRHAPRGDARFTIPTRTAASHRSLVEREVGATPRGPITKLGRKLFKVLVIPMASKLLGSPLSAIVGAVERRRCQELIRALTPNDYRVRVVRPLTDWPSLTRGRSLLLVHGLFSSTEGMLAGLPPQAMELLYRMYEGRVIAFDQLTVTRSPEENARFFLKELRARRPGGSIELDVIAHSRGGIVSRILAEHGRELDPEADCVFRKLYFVATPNAGSPLADPDHVMDMIDVFTNFATNFPDGAASYTLEVLLSIVKLLAATAERTLPGIAAIGTAGFIGKLNGRGGYSNIEYAAAAANYEPDPYRDNGFFTGRFADVILDRVFEEQANDLVVPRESVAGANGRAGFPIMRQLTFASADHVWHSGFFQEPRTIAHIAAFLGKLDSTVLDIKHDASPGITRTLEVAEGAATERAAAVEDSDADSAWLVTRSAEQQRIPATRAETGIGALLDRWALDHYQEVVRAAASVRRDPRILFHELVRAGEQNPLEVQLIDAVAATTLQNAIEIAIARGQELVELTVSLSAPGFDVKPKRDQVIKVGRVFDAERERVTFLLTAREPGPAPVSKEIRADIWLGTSCLGAVAHYTTVVPSDYKEEAVPDGRSRSEPFALSVTRQECDLIVQVNSRDESGRPPFTLSLRSEIPGDAYVGKPAGKMPFSARGVAAHMQKLFETFTKSYPDSSNNAALARWRSDLLNAIDTLGKNLWIALPKQFQSEYFRLLDAGTLPRSINIFSDETIIPWELIIPHRDGKTYPRLGVAHIMGRWRPGLGRRPSLQRMRVQHAVLVNPRYDGSTSLAWSLLEAADLKKLIPTFSVIRPADLDSVKTVLGRDDVQFFHYTGHGRYVRGDADLSALDLDFGGELPAASFVGAALLGKGRPILYLNACSVGAGGVVLGQMGGFAATCLTAGCSGVIAPYWSVNDDSAKRFAVEFYMKLMRGRAIGEALQELRRDNPDEPTFQAFAYFGDPWTRPQFPQSNGTNAKATETPKTT